MLRARAASAAICRGRARNQYKRPRTPVGTKVARCEYLLPPPSCGVTVISKDQNASGDLGVYDLKKKTITLTGNVVVSQGKNVLHGDRVVVDTVTGNAHLDSGVSSQNRVRALILPNKGDNGGAPNFMSIGPKAN